MVQAFYSQKKLVSPNFYSKVEATTHGKLFRVDSSRCNCFPGKFPKFSRYLQKQKFSKIHR